MNKQTIFLIVLITIITSCTNQTNNNSDKKETSKHNLFLKETQDSISFKLDKRTTNYSACMYFFKDSDNTNYLAYLNEPSREILFFNIDSLKLSHRVPLDKEGTNATGWVRGFHIISKDSIIVTVVRNPVFFLINSKGNVINKYGYNKTADGKNVFAFTARSFLNSPLVILSGKLYGKQNIFDAFNPDFDKVPQSSIAFEFDIKNNSVKLLPIYFPTNYWDEGKKPMFFSRTFGGGSFVWSFNYDHNLYKYSPSGKLLKVSNAKSKYIEEFVALSKNLKGLRYFVTTPRYREIIYDKYRKVYYRFAYAGIELKKDDKVESLFKYPKQFSIITLDSDLNIIDEILLAPNTYNINGWFVSPKGLYISTDHINNPSLNEDKLTFRLFKLSK